MIFVTVGTQLPFERLIEAMDAWAEQHPAIEVFAQTGDTRYQPRHMTFSAKLTPQQYAEKFAAARVVVSHAGMGTIISGLENAKPLVLMPRLAAKGEHRNDHQLGTAQKFDRFDLIHVVENAEQLHGAIDACLNVQPGVVGGGPQTSPELIEKLRAFVAGVGP